MNELDNIRERVTMASGQLLEAIHAFEHAIADAHTVEAAHLVASTIGQCYVAFDRVNVAAVSRHAHLSVTRDIAKAQGHD